MDRYPPIIRAATTKTLGVDSGGYDDAMLLALKAVCIRHEQSERFIILRYRCISIFFFFFLTIATATVAIAQMGTAWPEADKLFHSDPRWLGADGAFSIDLGGGRVLWMFGDTFVARKRGDTRTSAAFVRNTVAIQTGYDPSHASIKFYWRTGSDGPHEIFESEKSIWMWPSSGIRIGSTLLLFCSRVRPDRAKNSLGFQAAGWVAYRVTNPDEEPTAWTLQKVVEEHDKVSMASAVLREGGFVYLLGVSEPEHDLYLARLSIEAFDQDKFDALEWWSGGEWRVTKSKRRPVIHEAGPEASVQRDPRGGGFLEINSQGFGATDIVMRRAPRLEGPWGAPQEVYRPPESHTPDAFVYAGKSHAELIGADLVLTYAANGDDKKLATDMSLYFPRFVKVELRSHASAQAQ
jgi:hypothetical protein